MLPLSLVRKYTSTELQRWTMLQEHLSELKLIIIFMVYGIKHFNFRSSLRLVQIFGFHKVFAGIAAFARGNFYQLLPVTI